MVISGGGVKAKVIDFNKAKSRLRVNDWKRTPEHKAKRAYTLKHRKPFVRWHTPGEFD
jgi:hypothetical protein